jgi:predicted Zn-dependent protease
MRHEFGHLFGLVNNGTPAQSDHEDTTPGSKAHCKVEGCLMVASLEFGNSALGVLEGANVSADFDEKCRLDLKANGGK